MTETVASENVVVGVDGSEKDPHTVSWAADEASRRGTGLHLLYAYPVHRPAIVSFSPPPPGMVVTPADIQTASRRITDAAEKLVREAHPDVEVTSTTISDQPAADALVAASEGAALVVIGARGLGRFAGRLLGSVSQKVAGNALAPVVVVREEAATEGPVVAGVDVENLGVPNVLDFAFGAAQRRGVGVKVVVGSKRDDLPDAADADERVAAQRLATEVQSVVDAWSGKFPDVPVEVSVTHGHPIEVLTEEGKTASLLVVGNRGRGGLGGPLGSVAFGVLHEAPAVAVVKVR